MTPEELLNCCSKRHWRLWVQGDKLCYDFPKGADAAQILEDLRQHKLEIIRLLQSPTLTSKNLFAVCCSAKENPTNSKQEDVFEPGLVAWEGDVPIYIYPGEKCIRCYKRLAVGTVECPRWCLECYERDKQFMKKFYPEMADLPRAPITYERPTRETDIEF